MTHIIHPTLAATTRALFNEHNACVLLPTYNNSGTVNEVINDILLYTDKLIVVNDGSTDNTKTILEARNDFHLVSYEKNKGKGFALRSGFRKANEMGYTHAIVLDSDGQHYPSDLHIFLEQLERTPKALMIGTRNLNQENVPTKSTFGNRFSSFWFWVETGIKLPDTQSGYRLYPVLPLANWKFFTNRYEFEIEVIVRTAWAGIPVLDVPVGVYYPPADERVSHFRPLKDFTRISILNTFLVLIAFLWIYPRNFFLMLTSKEGWRKLWHNLFINPSESNQRKAWSLGFGVFMGIVPIWGFQLAVGIPLAVLMRLNKALFILAANISIFPPIIWLASLATGKWLLGSADWNYKISEMNLERLKSEGAAFFLGGAVLATVAGLLTYMISWVLLKYLRNKKEHLYTKEIDIK